MRRLTELSYFVFAVLCTGISVAESQIPSPLQEKGFVSIFNGVSLDGWAGGAGYHFVEDGMLISNFPAQAYRKHDANLFYARLEYGDFVLRFDYRIGLRSNSGVLIRAPMPDDSKKGIEIQIIDNAISVSSPKYHNGALAGIEAAQQGYENPPGQWNQMEITCVGCEITVKLNGAEILASHVAKTQAKGRIALFGYCSQGRVDYRNLRVRELGGQAGTPGRGGGELRQRSHLAITGSEPTGQHPDQAAIEGDWHVTAVRRNGEVVAVPGGDRYVFVKGAVTIHTTGNFPAQLRYKLNNLQTPKQLDVVFESGDEKLVSPMVYELQGDTLRICYSEPGTPRPADLATTPGDRRTLITMNRKPHYRGADRSAPPPLGTSVGPGVLSQAISLYLGTTGHTDNAKARELFLQASDAGDPLARMWVARCYHKARCGFPKDESKAQELAREVTKEVECQAKEENPTAMTLWASALDSGLGVANQPVEAIGWYRKAAEAGDLLAMGNLATTLFDRGDRPGAVAWHRKAAEAGLPSSMVELGDLYRKGEGGVRRDEKEAIHWFLKAADAGNTDAMLGVGLTHDNGIGVRCDPQEAVKWYRKGAELGNAGCMNNLGQCYENGRGVPESSSEAVHWFQRAAEAGNRCAMFNLGHMYYWGKGVPADPNNAKEWIRKSADAGFEQAKVALRELNLERSANDVPRYTPSSRIRVGGPPSQQAIDQAQYQAGRAMRQFQQQTAGNLGSMGLIWVSPTGQTSGYGTTPMSGIQPSSPQKIGGWDYNTYGGAQSGAQQGRNR